MTLKADRSFTVQAHERFSAWKFNDNLCLPSDAVLPGQPTEPKTTSLAKVNKEDFAKTKVGYVTWELISFEAARIRTKSARCPAPLQSTCTI